MGGVDGAPAFVQPGVLEQPFDRPGAERLDTVVHFLGLLGRMDMDGTYGGGLDQRRQFVRRDRPQAVWGNAEVPPSAALTRRRLASSRSA
jgi:hypothetical protein